MISLLYYLVNDGQDGSADVDFFKTRAEAEEALESDPYGQYGLNEGVVGVLSLADYKEA